MILNIQIRRYDMASLIVEFKNVNKKFGTTQALDNLCFQIPENCIVGLIGSNGAGKTTSLRHIIRYLQPDSGAILYHGKDIYTLPHTDFPIAYIPDSPIFYEELTVLEHLSFVSTLYNTTSSIKELISIMDVERHLNKVPSVLSKGTKQKLSIMCALLRKYELLVADEPFMSLDPKQIYVFKNILLELKNQGKTIIISTHLLNIIDNICDYYVMIERGKLLAEGKLEDIIQAGKCTSLEELYLHLATQSDDYSSQVDQFEEA